MPYGSSIELGYAKKLWQALERNRLVGKEAINTTPKAGQDPHGVVLETLSGKLKVLGHEGQFYLQRNYLGKKITRSRVAKHRSLYIKSISVMMKRSYGYDLDNKNWYWVEFAPDGSVVRKIEGLPAAGRVAKGEKFGCIACHAGAPGGDFVFSNTAMKLDH